MIISKSNFASDATVTANPQSALIPASVMVDGDYSSVYSDALQSETTITLDFGQLRTIEYLAIGGSNVTTKDRIRITAVSNQQEELLDSNGEMLFDSDGEQLFALTDAFIDDITEGINQSRVIMYKLDAGQISSISITVYGTGQLKIAEIACGEIFEVPNGGEQAGYARPWSVPNVKNRSASNLQNAPINQSFSARTISGTLVVDNLVNADNDKWDEMVNFGSRNTFYVLEDDDKLHSFVGFNMEVKPLTADARTRKINKASISYNAYARESIEL